MTAFTVHPRMVAGLFGRQYVTHEVLRADGDVSVIVGEFSDGALAAHVVALLNEHDTPAPNPDRPATGAYHCGSCAFTAPAERLLRGHTMTEHHRPTTAEERTVRPW